LWLEIEREIQSITLSNGKSMNKPRPQVMVIRVERNLLRAVYLMAEKKGRE